ncbi:MAG TPA: hypothetical protein VG370_03175 [Chloroflexota bacterium]|nr:hypothetical protein [Chloroflexota bacterium]
MGTGTPASTKGAPGKRARSPAAGAASAASTWAAVQRPAGPARARAGSEVLKASACSSQAPGWKA